MPYLGSAPATSFLSMTSQSFTGGSGTSFTLNKAVSTTSDIAVFVNNVRQSPVNSSYSVSGTTLTMSASIASSDNFYVVFLGSAVGTITPASGSVGTSQIVDEAITSSKLASGVGGSQVLVTTTTISDGDTSIIFSNLNSYDNYKIEFIRVTHNTSAGAMLKYQGGTDASTFVTSSNYDRVVGSMVYNGNDTIVNEDLDGATSIQMLSDANRWEGNVNHYLDGHAYIYAKAGANTGQYPRLHFHIAHSHTTNNRTVVTRGGGFLNSTSTITSAKFSLSTGSFKSGKVKLYGIT